MDEVGVRLPVGPQVSERGHFRSGFLWQRTKKTTDSAAHRALRAHGGRFIKYKAEDFLEGGFFGGEDRINVSLTHPPIRAHLRSAKLPTETGSYTLLLQHRSGQLFYPCSLPQSHHFPVLQNCEPHDLPSLCCPTLCRGDMQH